MVNSFAGSLRASQLPTAMTQVQLSEIELGEAPSTGEVNPTFALSFYEDKPRWRPQPLGLAHQ
jgi:hypothetical protein